MSGEATGQWRRRFWAAGYFCSPHLWPQLVLAVYHTHSLCCSDSWPFMFVVFLLSGFYNFFELVYYISPYFGLYLHLFFHLSAWRVKELFPVTFSCTVCNFSSKFPYHAFNCLFHTRFSLLFLQNILKAFSYDFFFHLWIICVFYCPNIWTILYLFFCN